MQMIIARFKKRGELEEVPEDQQNELKAGATSWNDKIQSYIDECIADQIAGGRVKVVSTLKTDASSEETQVRVLKKLLKPRVILVNHEKRLGTDTTCANLAIKYNMIYISAYQVIRQHIEEGTEFGKRLEATKKAKDIVLQT